MKCPNCYSRKIKHNKCELCGKDIESPKIPEKNIKKMIIMIVIIVILIMFVIAIVNHDKIIDYLKTSREIAKIKNNYKTIIKILLFLSFGFISIILMSRGSHNKNELRKYDSYLLGKIIDYRPSSIKGNYHPIVEYEVSNKKYRIVGKRIKTRELYGLVGIKYRLDNPLEAVIDGEKNGEFEFILGLIISIVLFAIIML